MSETGLRPGDGPEETTSPGGADEKQMNGDEGRPGELPRTSRQGPRRSESQVPDDLIRSTPRDEPLTPLGHPTFRKSVRNELAALERRAGEGKAVTPQVLVAGEHIGDGTIGTNLNAPGGGPAGGTTPGLLKMQLPANLEKKALSGRGAPQHMGDVWDYEHYFDRDDLLVIRERELEGIEERQQKSKEAGASFSYLEELHLSHVQVEKVGRQEEDTIGKVDENGEDAGGEEMRMGESDVVREGVENASCVSSKSELPRSRLVFVTDAIGNFFGRKKVSAAGEEGESNANAGSGDTVPLPSSPASGSGCAGAAAAAPPLTSSEAAAVRPPSQTPSKKSLKNPSVLDEHLREMLDAQRRIYGFAGSEDTRVLEPALIDMEHILAMFPPVLLSTAVPDGRILPDQTGGGAGGGGVIGSARPPIAARIANELTEEELREKYGIEANLFFRPKTIGKAIRQGTTSAGSSKATNLDQIIGGNQDSSSTPKITRPDYIGMLAPNRVVHRAVPMTPSSDPLMATQLPEGFVAHSSPSTTATAQKSASGSPGTRGISAPPADLFQQWASVDVNLFRDGCDLWNSTWAAGDAPHLSAAASKTSTLLLTGGGNNDYPQQQVVQDHHFHLQGRSSTPPIKADLSALRYRGQIFSPSSASSLAGASDHLFAKTIKKITKQTSKGSASSRSVSPPIASSRQDPVRARRGVHADTNLHGAAPRRVVKVFDNDLGVLPAEKRLARITDRGAKTIGQQASAGRSAEIRKERGDQGLFEDTEEEEQRTLTSRRSRGSKNAASTPEHEKVRNALRSKFQEVHTYMKGDVIEYAQSTDFRHEALIASLRDQRRKGHDIY